MKSEVKVATPAALTYPLFKRDDRDGETILLTDSHTGTVVVRGGPWTGRMSGGECERPVGYFSDDWDEVTCVAADHWKILPAGSTVILTA